MKSIQIYQIWVNDQVMYSDIFMNLSQAINAFKYYKGIYKNVKIVDTTTTTMQEKK